MVTWITEIAQRKDLTVTLALESVSKFGSCLVRCELVRAGYDKYVDQLNTVPPHLTDEDAASSAATSYYEPREDDPDIDIPIEELKQNIRDKRDNHAVLVLHGKASTPTAASPDTANVSTAASPQGLHQDFDNTAPQKTTAVPLGKFEELQFVVPCVRNNLEKGSERHYENADYSTEQEVVAAQAEVAAVERDLQILQATIRSGGSTLSATTTDPRSRRGRDGETSGPETANTRTSGSAAASDHVALPEKQPVFRTPLGHPPLRMRPARTQQRPQNGSGRGEDGVGVAGVDPARVLDAQSATDDDDHGFCGELIPGEFRKNFTPMVQLTYQKRDRSRTTKMSSGKFKSHCIMVNPLIDIVHSTGDPDLTLQVTELCVAIRNFMFEACCQLYRIDGKARSENDIQQLFHPALIILAKALQSEMRREIEIIDAQNSPLLVFDDEGNRTTVAGFTDLLAITGFTAEGDDACAFAIDLKKTLEGFGQLVQLAGEMFGIIGRNSDIPALTLDIISQIESIFCDGYITNGVTGGRLTRVKVPSGEQKFKFSAAHGDGGIFTQLAQGLLKADALMGRAVVCEPEMVEESSNMKSHPQDDSSGPGGAGRSTKDIKAAGGGGGGSGGGDGGSSGGGGRRGSSTEHSSSKHSHYVPSTQSNATGGSTNSRPASWSNVYVKPKIVLKLPRQPCPPVSCTMRRFIDSLTNDVGDEI
jgi:hypothetical protein